MLGGIVRLLCEVSIFEQAMRSDRSVTLLPINLEIQTLLQCDSVAGYVNVHEFKSVLACAYDKTKLRVRFQCGLTRAPLLSYWMLGEEVWQMDAFDQNSELEA